MDGTEPQRGWMEVLRGFSRRNHGRPTRLETDEAGAGAPWAEVTLTLRAARYEPRSGRVELVLDDASEPATPLTHSVDRVTALAVDPGTDGRDGVLRLTASGGLTRLVMTDAA